MAEGGVGTNIEGEETIASAKLVLAHASGAVKVVGKVLKRKDGILQLETSKVGMLRPVECSKIALRRFDTFYRQI